MQPAIQVRVANVEDAVAICEIYRFYVENTAISFEVVPPAADEMAQRITTTLQHYPWLVCEVQGKVAGFAYAHAYGERAAYAWSVISSVYVAQNLRHAGIGKHLYAVLEALLTAQHVRSVYAWITSPNIPSEKFHARLGYQKQGDFPGIGYKFGAPVGVTHYCKQLLPAIHNPPQPIPFTQLSEAAVQAALLVPAKNGDAL